MVTAGKALTWDRNSRRRLVEPVIGGHILRMGDSGSMSVRSVRLDQIGIAQGRQQLSQRVLRGVRAGVVGFTASSTSGSKPAPSGASVGPRLASPIEPPATSPCCHGADGLLNGEVLCDG